jgi:hypothetical protein
VFVNRELRIIFGPKRDKVIGIWRKLHNKEFCLQSSPNILRTTELGKMRWVVHIACTGEKKAYRVWVGTPGGRRPLGRPIQRPTNSKSVQSSAHLHNLSS